MIRVLRTLAGLPAFLLTAPGKIVLLVGILRDLGAIADYVEELYGPGDPRKREAALKLSEKLYDVLSRVYPALKKLPRAEYLSLVRELLDVVVALNNAAGRYAHARKPK